MTVRKIKHLGLSDCGVGPCKNARWPASPKLYTQSIYECIRYKKYLCSFKSTHVYTYVCVIYIYYIEHTYICTRSLCMYICIIFSQNPEMGETCNIM